LPGRELGIVILLEHGRWDARKVCYRKSFQSFSCSPMRGVGGAGVRGKRHCLRPPRQPLTRRKYHSPSELEKSVLMLVLKFLSFFSLPFALGNCMRVGGSEGKGWWEKETTNAVFRSNNKDPFHQRFDFILKKRKFSMKKVHHVSGFGRSKNIIRNKRCVKLYLDKIRH
jgi:hypothetical protein